MADDRWRTIRHVIDRITSEGESAEFFQLVRLIEASRCRTALLPPGTAVKERAGTSRRLSDEAVRFRAAISAHFEPASSRPLAGAQHVRGNEPAVIETNFMAPAGAQGALPQHYTSLILQRLREDDSSLKDFLDLFHHRLMSCFVRGWEKYRHFINYEQAHDNVGGHSSDRPKQADSITQCVRSLVDRTPYSAPLGFDENVLLYYAGVFSDRRRSAVSLKAVLEDYLGVRVTIRELHPRRTQLLPEYRWRLPRNHSVSRAGPALGDGLILGTSVLVAQTSFLMQIGPLGLNEFRQHLPNGNRFGPLNRMIRYYVGFEFVFEVQLLLKAEEAPPFRLGTSRGDGVRLGWESWIGDGSLNGVLDQVRFVVST